MDWKNIDWQRLKKYTSPQAAGDLNAFLEALPQRAGQISLIGAGIAWTVACTIGLYAFVQTQEMTQLRRQLLEAEALRPPVPSVRDVSVPQAELQAFVERAKDIYRGLTITSGGSNITITASATRSFTEFREAVGHVQNGGAGWRVNIERLCVGRECQGTALGATLKVSKVSIDEPK